MASQTMEEDSPIAPHSHTLPLKERCAAAGVASLVSALIVNPLDVVKTRLQTQQVTGMSSAASRIANPQTLQTWAVAGCMNACQRVASSASAGPGPLSAATAAAAGAAGRAAGGGSGAALCASHCYVYDSALDGLLKIVRQEGPLVLWRGTAVSLLMAVPSVGIYLPLYDVLLTHLADAAASSDSWQGSAPLIPLAAGASARTITVAATAPLELTRTRIQASSAASRSPFSYQGTFSYSGTMASASSSGRSMAAAAGELLRHPRALAGMWRGLGANLARDVPFSAIYWGTVEPIRGRLLRAPDVIVGVGVGDGDGVSGGGGEGLGGGARRVVAANVVAGSLAGGLAAAVTTPLDVAKTLVQVQGGGGAGGGAMEAGAQQRLTTLRVLADLARRRGLGGLFAGWSARVARTAPSCAIVLSAYEALKAWYQLSSSSSSVDSALGSTGSLGSTAAVVSDDGGSATEGRFVAGSGGSGGNVGGGLSSQQEEDAVRDAMPQAAVD